VGEGGEAERSEAEAGEGSGEIHLMTYKSQIYKKISQEYAEHGTVDHSRYEYVRGDIHTNAVEGYYSIFKRGMKGVYQHWAPRLRPLGIKGKRLTYRRPRKAKLQA
jgi:hypothetical protein